MKSYYALIPMDKISDDARKIAIMWLEVWSPGFNIDEKHKLASDIMNYANSRVENIANDYVDWLEESNLIMVKGTRDLTDDEKKMMFADFVKAKYKSKI